jgi:hypothetical protein
MVEVRSTATPRAAARRTEVASLEREFASVRRDARSQVLWLRPGPGAVAAILAEVPAGTVITESELRVRLLDRYGGEQVEPRALRAAVRALAARAARGRGRPGPCPLWRLLRDDGSVAPGVPLAPLYCATRLREEGQRVGWDHGRWKVLPRSG